MINLEPQAAQAGQAMLDVESDSPKEQENFLTKALMVLAEQGIYALGLFLVSQKGEADQKRAQRLHRALADLLHATGLSDQEAPAFQPAYYQRLTEGSDQADLARLLLSKQILETALTYGRYHAKGLRT